MKRISPLKKIDQERQEVAAATPQAKKSAYGQFFTPEPIARFMAGLMPLEGGPVRLLDAGAGIGALSAAVLERRPDATVTAYELDETLIDRLRANLGDRGVVMPHDFIQHGVFGFKAGTLGGFTHAILNPPYKKIATSSAYRQLLSKVGLETVNLYSGFVGLALLLLEKGGVLCAIIPRSFCNGPYYRPFRQLLFREASLRRMHLFDSRKEAFADDGVLQENVIIVLERGARQGRVVLSRSTDASFSDLREREHAFSDIVRDGDDDGVIHFPTGNAGLPATFSARLADLDLTVSTGPVVDFRLKDHLLAMPEGESVPLLYPAHFSEGAIAWPREGMKKPNAIRLNADTQKWLFPSGDYAVVRRFSSKEERRRVVASHCRGDLLGYRFIGFENHVNVFHRRRTGLPRQLARGLTVYLNSTLLDEYFRVFNGHTQVNATDLRMMTYPDLDGLQRLGSWAAKAKAPTQAEIDAQVEGIA